jgi:ABC-2 type transport system permease protein
MGIIFCVIFVCTEHNSGFIKGVVSRKGYRSQMSISKAITMVVYSLIQFAASIGVFLLVYHILFGGFQFASVENFMRYVATQLLIQIGLMNLCILFCNLVRNMAFSMAFGICISAGLVSLIMGLIDRFNLPFNTKDYLLSILMRQLPVSYDNTLYIRALIISVGSVVIYQAASLITMKKQDI